MLLKAVFEHEFDKTIFSEIFMYGVFMLQKNFPPHIVHVQKMEVRKMFHFSFNLPNVGGELMNQVKKFSSFRINFWDMWQISSPAT